MIQDLQLKVCKQSRCLMVDTDAVCRVVVSSLNWTKCPPRWVWTPGSERWSTGRCRTRRLTRSKTPSYRSTRWCTGTPTQDSSPPTSTSRWFTAARVPPPSPSPRPPPPPPLILWSCTHRTDARPFHRLPHALLLLLLLPGQNLKRNYQTLPPESQISPITAKTFFSLSFFHPNILNLCFCCQHLLSSRLLFLSPLSSWISSALFPPESLCSH